MSKLDTLDPYVRDRSEWEMADYLDAGRAHFDVAGYREAPFNPWQPSDREAFARAYALIAAPRSVSKGVVE
ncbi:hypothetical protein [Sphingomonas sp.]|uniref:hypothetical protein n=1 Tax=Sphingomonas sp. TaxID=28214 RepID=UPI0031D996C7